MFDPVGDLIFALVTLLAGVFGGDIGLAIVLVTIALRLALLPLTLRIAQHSLEQRQIRQRLQPDLECIQERYADESDRRASEILPLYHRHGYQPRFALRILTILVEVPLFGGFFSAIRRGLGVGVRFLGIANLGKPSVILAVVVAALAYMHVTIGASSQGNARAALFFVLVVLILAWQASAAMALHWGSSSLVSLLQTILVQRKARKFSQSNAA